MPLAAKPRRIPYRRPAVSSRLGSRGRPAETRAAILDAAVREFARDGIAGARTDAIARAAGVNKALLYYYFRDKEALYGAVLDHVFGGLAARVRGALEADAPRRDKVLSFVSTHFDYLASNPLFPRVVHSELMRAGSSGSPHIQRLVERYLRPAFGKLRGILTEGIPAGEFRAVDPVQFILTMVAGNVFYFTSTPMLRAMLHADPLSPELLALRRRAVLDFVSAALFAPGGSARRARGKKGRRA